MLCVVSLVHLTACRKGLKWQTYCCTWDICEKNSLLISSSLLYIPAVFLCQCPHLAATWQLFCHRATPTLPTPGLSSGAFMCLQLFEVGTSARKMPDIYKTHSWSKGSGSTHLLSCHISWPLTSSHTLWALVSRTGCVWGRDHVHVGVAWRALGLSYQDNGKTAWEPPLPTRPSHSQHQLCGCLCLYVCVCVCGCVSFSFSLSPWVVIFMQPYGVTAQIINYSLPRERDSKRGSATVQKGSRGCRGNFGVWGSTERERVEVLHNGWLQIAQCADISTSGLVVHCFVFKKVVVEWHWIGLSTDWS